MKTLSITIILFSLTFQMKGQVIDEKLKVVKEYDNEIYAVNPFFDYSSIRLPDNTEEASISDTLIGLSYQRPIPDVLIQALKYQDQKKSETYRGYIKGHHGTLNPLSLDASYSHQADNYFNIEGRVLIDRWEEDEISNKFSRLTSGQMALKYYHSDQVFSRIDLMGSQSTFGLYPYNQEPNELSTGQNQVNRFNAAYQINSFKTGKHALNYLVNMNYDRTSSTQLTSQENTIAVGGALNYSLGQSWAIHVSNHFDHNSLGSQKQSINKVNTSIRITNSRWLGSIGASAYRSNSRFSFFPAIVMKYQWDRNTYFGIDVSEKQVIQNLNATSHYNPFIDHSTFSPTIAQSKSYRAYVVSKFKDKYGVSFSAAYQSWNNDLNFVHTSAGKETFATQEIDYNLLQFQLEVENKINDHFSSGIEISFNEYRDESSPVYHKPRTEISPYLKSSLLNDKLSIRLSGQFIEGQYIFDQSGNSVKSDIKKNLSASISYSVFDRANIYLNADNILGDDYQAWSGYQVFGRNLSIGAMIKI